MLALPQAAHKIWALALPSHRLGRVLKLTSPQGDLCPNRSLTQTVPSETIEEEG